MEGEMFSRTTDVVTKCNCATRTCGPHRCWMSRAAVVVIAVLLIYTIVMHSLFFTEREDIRQNLSRQMVGQAMTEVNARLDTTFDLFREHTLKPAEKRINIALNRLKDVQYIGWAMTTPEVQRDVELRQMIDTLRD